MILCAIVTGTNLAKPTVSEEGKIYIRTKASQYSFTQSKIKKLEKKSSRKLNNIMKTIIFTLLISTLEE